MKEETVLEADHREWVNSLHPPVGYYKLKPDVTNPEYLMKCIETLSARLTDLERRLNEITK